MLNFNDVQPDSNSGEFEKLNKRELLECINCSSNKIKKSIMSPMIANKKYNSFH